MKMTTRNLFAFRFVLSFGMALALLFAAGCKEDELPIHTVTFDSQGGSKVEPEVVKCGGKATKPSDPTKEGYTFTGWYTDASATKEFDFNTAVDDDITLYAGWEEGG